MDGNAFAAGLGAQVSPDGKGVVLVDGEDGKQGCQRDIGDDGLTEVDVEQV